MGMLDGLMGGLIDKETLVKDYLRDALKDVSEELGCKHNELFFTISASNTEFEPTFYVFLKDTNGVPKPVRPISIAEILGNEEEG